MRASPHVEIVIPLNPVDWNDCGEARAMLDCYTAALTAFYKSQEDLLGGMLPGHPRYSEVCSLKNRAFETALRARKIYWDHVAEHKCRKPASPFDLAYEKH
jgi:hypothetical protein